MFAYHCVSFVWVLCIYVVFTFPVKSKYGDVEEDSESSSSEEEDENAEVIFVWLKFMVSR